MSDCCTIAALSQCVMFSNRFVKWMEAQDGTNNDALCLPAIFYINVPLITACVNHAPKGTDDPVLCSCTDTPIYKPALALSLFSVSTTFYVNLSVFISWVKMERKSSLNIIYVFLEERREKDKGICTRAMFGKLAERKLHFRCLVTWHVAMSVGPSLWSRLRYWMDCNTFVISYFSLGLNVFAQDFSL